MTAQHTPGPWIVSDEDAAADQVAPFRTTINGMDWQCLANVVVRIQGDDHDKPEGRANARLIAAAPDLLALAERYASECGECAGTRIKPDDEPCEECEFIWEVIDKARGQANATHTRDAAENSSHTAVCENEAPTDLAECKHANRESEEQGGYTVNEWCHDCGRRLYPPDDLP